LGAVISIAQQILGGQLSSYASGACDGVVSVLIAF